MKKLLLLLLLIGKLVVPMNRQWNRRSELGYALSVNGASIPRAQSNQSLLVFYLLSRTLFLRSKKLQYFFDRAVICEVDHMNLIYFVPSSFHHRQRVSRADWFFAWNRRLDYIGC